MLSLHLKINVAVTIILIKSSLMARVQKHICLASAHYWLV